MIAQLLPPLYVGALYAASRVALLRGNARQGIVVDALAFNWLCATLASAVIPYPNVVPAYICIDMMSALWLSLRVQGRCAGIAEVFYLALILFNAAFFFRRAFSPWTHWVGLSVISWGQLVAVTTGVLRHDLAKVAGHYSAFRWVRNHLGLRKKETQR